MGPRLQWIQQVQRSRQSQREAPEILLCALCGTSAVSA
jgi:hypothetical protein